MTGMTSISSAEESGVQIQCTQDDRMIRISRQAKLAQGSQFSGVRWDATGEKSEVRSQHGAVGETIEMSKGLMCMTTTD